MKANYIASSLISLENSCSHDLRTQYATGDITLRVQPGAETNTSSWATYSSSQADAHVQQCGTTTLSTTTPMDAIVVNDDNVAMMLASCAVCMHTYLACMGHLEDLLYGEGAH